MPYINSFKQGFLIQSLPIEESELEALSDEEYAELGHEDADAINITDSNILTSFADKTFVMSKYENGAAIAHVFRLKHNKMYHCINNRAQVFEHAKLGKVFKAITLGLDNA